MYKTITLDDIYRIETDENYFTLKKKITTFSEKLKKDVTRDESWYFPNLSQCLTVYLKDAPKACETVKEMLEKVLEIEKTVNLIRAQVRHLEDVKEEIGNIATEHPKNEK